MQEAFTMQDWEEMEELPLYEETMQYLEEKFGNQCATWRLPYTAMKDLATKGDTMFAKWLPYCHKLGLERSENCALTAAVKAGQTVLVSWIIDERVVCWDDLKHGLLDKCIRLAEENNQQNVLYLLKELKDNINH